MKDKVMRVAALAVIMSLVFAVTACGVTADYKDIGSALDAYTTGSYIVGKTVSISTDRDKEASDRLEALGVLYNGEYFKGGSKYDVIIWIENDCDWESGKKYTVRITDVITDTTSYFVYGTIQK